MLIMILMLSFGYPQQNKSRIQLELMFQKFLDSTTTDKHTLSGRKKYQR